MKKLISLLCTAAMIPSALSLSEVKAVNEAPVISEGTIPYVVCQPELPNGRKKATENPNLYALASSLGADDAYFNFPNYTTTEMSDEAIEMLDKCGEGTLENKQAEKILPAIGPGGVCYGYSAIQILTHNGIISPSDIQEGAETLHEIMFDEKVNDAICYYHCTQVHVQTEVIREYYTNHNDAEACADLIYQGEKAMESGKYFQISFLIPNGVHAVVGIGIAEGNWVYNDKTYDKCILTLDSNAVRKENQNIAHGFTDKGCIYINSEEGSFYIPAYEASSENENTDIFSIIDDMDLLNHFGMFNPSESINEEYYDIQKISILNNDAAIDITTEYKGVSETYHAEIDSPLDGMDNYTENLGMRYYYKKADNLMFEIINSTINASTTVDMGDQENNQHILVKGNVKVSMNNTTISLDPINEEAGSYSMNMVQRAIGKPFYHVNLGINKTDTFKGKVAMTLCDDGVLFTTDNGFAGYCSMITEAFDFDNSDDTTGMFDFAITSVDDFFLKFVSDVEPPVIMIDLDDDGVFESEVQKGDVNCDGKITANDAANVLSAYSADQVDGTGILLAGQNHYINENIADYNGDGSMTAVDAALILSDYAQSQIS